MNNCTALAASLSANYFSATTYTPPLPPITTPANNNNLNNYLSNNGILLSMCISGSDHRDCGVDHGQSHLSASYIHKDIGVRILPARPPVGIILDPTKNEVKCAYPTDGGTDGRDDKGCGPIAGDPVFGSRGAKKLGRFGRFLVKQSVNWYKIKNFGRNRDWLDISCQEFFKINDELAQGTSWHFDGPYGSCDDWKRDASKFRVDYEPFMSTVQAQLEAYMGHPVCTVQDSQPHFGKFNWFEYTGECSWDDPLQEWQDMVDIMVNHILKETPEVTVWNEVVLKTPPDLSEAVLAVFYVLTEGMEQTEVDYVRYVAEEKVKALGSRHHLLLMDLRKDNTPSFGQIEDELGTEPSLLTCAEPLVDEVSVVSSLDLEGRINEEDQSKIFENAGSIHFPMFETESNGAPAIPHLRGYF